MDASCNVCFKPAEQLFETGKPGVYSCFKCQPLSIVPEVTIDDEEEEETNNDEAQASDADEGAVAIVVEGESSEGRYKCDLCNKVFEKNQQYQNHVRNHRAERRYVCTYCNKAFSQSNNLRAHLRIHTNERPYKCSECGKAFTQVTNLNNHVRLHTGERPYVCPEPGCNKAYAQVTNLNQHRKRHLGGRPVELTYDCTVCGAQFDQRNHMYMHRKQIHPDAKPERSRSAPVPCAECGEVLAGERQLARHYTLVHAVGANVTISLEPKYKCMFENCGRAYAEASQHAEHLLKHHQLRVTGKFPIKGVTVRSAPAASAPDTDTNGFTPAKRGRPPKSKVEVIVPEPSPGEFQFVDPQDTKFEVEVTEENNYGSSTNAGIVKIISNTKRR